MTVHLPGTHYGSGTGGYKIMVSWGTWFSPERDFWKEFFHPSVCLLVSLRCCSCMETVMASVYSWSEPLKVLNWLLPWISKCDLGWAFRCNSKGQWLSFINGFDWKPTCHLWDLMGVTDESGHCVISGLRCRCRCCGCALSARTLLLILRKRHDSVCARITTMPIVRCAVVSTTPTNWALGVMGRNPGKSRTLH